MSLALPAPLKGSAAISGGNVFYSPWFLNAAKALPYYKGLMELGGLPVCASPMARFGIARAAASPYSPLSSLTHYGRHDAHQLFDALKANGYNSLALFDFGLDALENAALERLILEGWQLQIISQHTRALAVVEGDQSAEDYLRSAMSSKRRKRGREARNRLQRLGNLSLETVCGAEAATKLIPLYLSLETGGWKGKQGSAISQSLEASAFLATLVHTSSPDQFAAHVLFAGDKPIASALTLHDGARAWYWKTAYDEAYANASPGVVLTIELTKYLLDQRRAKLIDSCATPKHPMIDGLWSERLPVLDLVISPQGQIPLKTKACTLGLRAFKQAKPLARKLLKRGK
jgi:hypothetical protein